MGVFLPIVSLFLSLACPRPTDQTDEGSAPSADVLEGASEAARAAWLRLVEAEGAARQEPITAFHLRAEARNRDGRNANDLQIEYRFLSPHFIRFALPGKNGAKRETGRAPGTGQEAYWLRDGEDVRDLRGRDNAESRRLVDEMLVVARNFIAFSDLSHLRLEGLELAGGPPSDLPLAWHTKPWWRKLTWLCVESPDFALLHPERRSERSGDTDPARPGYTVELGLDPDDGLPRVAVVREGRPAGAAADTPTAAPLAFQLDRYAVVDGFRVPHQILVHPLADQPGGPRFSDEASQEIYLLEVDLQPTLTPEDFRP